MLGETNPNTSTASERAQVLIDIIAKLTSPAKSSEAENGDENRGVKSVDASRVAEVRSLT